MTIHPQAKEYQQTSTYQVHITGFEAFDHCEETYADKDSDYS